MMPAPAKNGLTRLYHSNVNLPRSVTQYEFTKNLGKSLEHLPKCDTTLEGKKKSVAGEDCGERLSLLLPEIEPNCDLVLDVDARDASATVVSTPDRNDLSRNNGSSDDVGDQFDYLTNFDDDNETAKTKLHHLGKYEMEHNWILHENLQKNLDNFEKKSKKLQIPKPGQEARAPITDRLTEVKRMLKPSAELGDYFNNLDPSQKELIAFYLRTNDTASAEIAFGFPSLFVFCPMANDSYVHVPKVANMDTETFQTKYRTQGPLDTKGKVQEAYRKIVMMINACHPRRKYYREEKPNTAATLKRMKKSIDKEEERDNTRSSLGFDMQLALTTAPEYRTERDIKKVAWVLRATKAFRNLFPAESETELARILAYERYDGNRLISYQEREPERFYYILTGKVQKVKEYRLSSGTVSRNEGYVEKGTTTDVEELEKNIPRDHHLVSRGQVEVLIIQRDDFLRLRNKTQGPPIEFLRTLELFMEFPVEVFIDTTDVIDLSYYGQNVLICDDSNRTPWLFIVKSGKVKVVRSQNVVNTEHDNKMFKGSTEDLGCVRGSSHANAMFGNLISQRKMKALRSNTFTLPEVLDDAREDSPRPPGFSFSRCNSFAESMGVIIGITKRHRPSITQLAKKPVSADPALLKKKSKRTKKPKSVKVSEERTAPDTEDKKPPTIDENVSIHIEDKKEKLFPPIIVEPQTNTNTTKLDIKDNTFKPHGTYLTREKTDFDSVYCNKQKRDSQLRKTYLQLDVLRRGDIFGLDSVSRKFQGLPDHVEEEGLEHLHPTLASEPKGVSLVSDGAEVIRISKRFFLLHAKNNTMLRVETMHREYMSPDEARTSLYTSETWNQYKSELMKRMVSALSSRT